MTDPAAHISVWCHSVNWDGPTVQDHPVDDAFVEDLPRLLADQGAVLDLPAAESGKARRLIPVRAVASVTIRPVEGETR